MKAAIISVGDELLRGDVVDTNASTLARLLGSRGIDVTTISVTGDTVTSLGRQLKACIDTADLVVVTGGLGPTRDDITRLAVARVVGEELRLDRSSQERIRLRFERSGKPLSEANERQALFPARAEIIDNTHGTAPGFICRSGGSTILCLPGVPFEMEAMAASAIDRALLAADEREQRATMALRLVGRSEADLDTSLGSLMDRDANPLLGLTVQEGEVRLHMTARPESGQSAESVLAEGEIKIRAALGKSVRADGGMVDLLAALRAKGWRIATAESCTGGLLADRITDVPGASDVFAGGTVAYTPQMKVEALGVRSETVQRGGMVSEAVAREMAEGICTRTGAEVGVGLTGIAGPGGGTPEVPEGQVCIAIRTPEGLMAETLLFEGGRRRVKERAASTAVRLLLDLLEEVPGGGRGGSAR